MTDSHTLSDNASSANTVASLLSPDARGNALLTAEGIALDHAALRQEVERLATQLRRAGLGPNDRIAIVLPNGPEMALVLLAAMSVGCAAPLNPKYREEEFRFYLDDLHASALLTRQGGAPAALAAAPDGISLIDVQGEGLAIDFVATVEVDATAERPSDRR